MVASLRRTDDVPRHTGVGTTPLTGKVDQMADSAEPPEPRPDDTPSADYVDGVPTFDFVRDKIEGRHATALGTTELADESAAGRSLAQQEEDRDTAARKRIEEIRRSLREE